jgi:hypothetical protein
MDWKQRFREALDKAFDEPSIQLLVEDYFDLSFAKLSPPGYKKTFEFRLSELIDQARMNDWLLDLVSAARERRPKNASLKAIAEDLGLMSTGPRLNNPTGKTLEALVQANAKSITPSVFRERLAQLESQVCWIDIPGKGGTGFLIGPDLVLTNQHVVDPILNSAVRWQDVMCRFDYRRASDNTLLERKKQVQVPLVSDKWLVDSAPPSKFDWDPTLGNAKSGECDYALLRLAERIGDVPIGGATSDTEVKDTTRSWIDVKQPAQKVAAGNQVFLLQHAEGEPLTLTVGTVKHFNTAGTRVRYDANSKHGSSGAPCFDADLQLVALHHAHDPKEPPAWNQGIPFDVIQAHWKRQGTVLS